MNDLASLIQIKGLRDSLMVSLPEASWEDQSAALMSQIDGQEAFFRGARLALDVGLQELKVNEMVELRDHLSERNVSLWAIVSESAITEKTAQLLGLATRISKPRPEESESFDPKPIEEDTALFVNRTLRSGTRVSFGGNIVVLGDVNPGAEIAADGNVIVWGRLRGAVHAGANGEVRAVVCALDLLPIRLQIADSLGSFSKKKDSGKPEMALIRDQRVIIEAWQPGNTN